MREARSSTSTSGRLQPLQWLANAPEGLICTPTSDLHRSSRRRTGGYACGCWLGVVTLRGDREGGPDENSGCRLEDFDGALRSGSPGESAVAGEQGGVQGFGECHVGRVVDSEVVS